MTKRNINLRPFFIVLSFLYATSISAQIGGEYTFSFLNLTENAKAAAAGGDLISAYDSNDVNTGMYNPANIQEQHHGVLGLNFLPLKQGIKKTSVSYTHKLPKVGLLNFSVQHIGYGEIASTDIRGFETGTINPQEYALSVGKSFVQDNFRMGFNLKFAGSSLGQYSANAILFDLGGTFVHPKKQLTASLLFKNVGFSTKKYVSGGDSNLPLNILAGLTFKPEHMPFQFTLTTHDWQRWDVQYLDPESTFEIDNNGDKIPEEKSFSEKLGRHINIGTNLILGNSVEFRLGYNHMRRKELKTENKGGTGFSFGAMLRIKRVNLELSKAYYFAASGSTVISVTTNLKK